MSTPTLDGAVAWWRASDYSGSGDMLDGSGNSHDAQFGSASGADANDPTFLTPDGYVDYDNPGTQFLNLPGTAGNTASTPDAAALDIVGDIDVRIRLNAADYTPASEQILFTKYDWGSQRSWTLFLNSGNLIFQHFTDGESATKVEIARAVPVGMVDGTTLWIRVTVDVSECDQKLYYSLNGTDWTQVGSTNTTAASSIHSGTANVVIGSTDNDSNPFPGNIYRAIIKDGIDGTTVFDADFTDRANVVEPFATFTEDSAQAATVTLNRSAAGRKSAIVDQPRNLKGTDDYHQVSDNAALDYAAADDFTIVFTGRCQDVTPAGDQVLIGKKDDLTTGLGYAIYIDTGGTLNVVIGDGANTAEDTIAGLANGETFTAALVRDGASGDTVEAFLDGVGSGSATDASALGTLANALDLYMGALDGGANYFDGSDQGFAIFASALSSADIILAGNELQGIIDHMPLIIQELHA